MIHASKAAEMATSSGALEHADTASESADDVALEMEHLEDEEFSALLQLIGEHHAQGASLTACRFTKLCLMSIACMQGTLARPTWLPS
jgi:hypothetical protein